MSNGDILLCIVTHQRDVCYENKQHQKNVTITQQKNPLSLKEKKKVNLENRKKRARSEFLIAVTMNVTAFCDITLCNLVQRCQLFVLHLFIISVPRSNIQLDIMLVP
jgi:hypothetical protein